MKQKLTKWQLVSLVATLVLAGLAYGIFERLAITRALDEENGRAKASVILLESSFRRELEKFRMASVVLAVDPDAVAALTSRTAASQAFLNRKFEALSKDMQASSIYLLDAQGLTLASSNWQEPTSFVGESYDFRAYFKEAMRMGSHEQFALGNVSRRPGLYISRRLMSPSGAIGVVVIKVEFDRLEEEWLGYGKPAFVTNNAGVILVTSRPSWRFQTIQLLDQATRERIINDKDFGDAKLDQNQLYADQNVVDSWGANSKSPKMINYLEARGKVAPDWTVHVLAPAHEAISQSVRSTRFGALGLILLLSSAFAIDMYRRRSLLARADLAASERVRELNDRLVHSNKLSILGQIAAGVGHEINQPLAAIGTYAASGKALLDAGATEEGRENFDRIGALTTKIGAITQELRNFSRKSPLRKEPISLRRAVDAALLLLHERCLTLHATIRLQGFLSEDNHTVIASQGGLEQVLVNLVQNALDAAGQHAEITISLLQHQGHYQLSVRDNGPGLSEAAMEKLFLPFSTSKPDGLGLGLVISRELVSDFGGELSAVSHSDGMEFMIRLPMFTKGRRQ